MLPPAVRELPQVPEGTVQQVHDKIRTPVSPARDSESNSGTSVRVGMSYRSSNRPASERGESPRSFRLFRQGQAPPRRFGPAGPGQTLAFPSKELLSNTGVPQS